MRMPFRRAPIRTGDKPIMVSYPERGLFVRERIFIPLWVTLLESALATLWRLGVRLVRFAVGHPRSTATTAVLAGLYRAGGWPADLALVVLLAVAAGLWAWRWPTSFERAIGVRVRSWWRFQRVYRPRWRRLMAGCGLIETHDLAEAMPQIAQLRSHPMTDDLVVTIAPGQIPADVTDSAEALAHGLGAWRVTARPIAAGALAVTVMWSDPLAHVIHPDLPTPDPDPTDDPTGRPDDERRDDAPVRLPVPAQSRAPEITPRTVLDRLEAVTVGLTESGTPWRLPLLPGLHLLISGSTGSGKSGLLWAILWQLQDLIRTGWISVTALDPKYVELRAVASSGLGTVTVDVPSMPAVLEDLVAELDDRCATMTGRKHHPTPDSPIRVVIVDELATLTALSDNKSKARVEQALGHLLSRGRAAGYLIILTSVEATKEVVRWRGLCPLRVCYRTDDDHADLVLGDGAHDAGAHTELIPEDTPGIAYARVEGRSGITRVRTLHVTDDHLDALIPASTPTGAAAPELVAVPSVPDTAEIPVITLPVDNPRPTKPSRSVS